MCLKSWYSDSDFLERQKRGEGERKREREGEGGREREKGEREKQRQKPLLSLQNDAVLGHSYSGLQLCLSLHYLYTLSLEAQPEVKL